MTNSGLRLLALGAALVGAAGCGPALRDLGDVEVYLNPSPSSSNPAPSTLSYDANAHGCVNWPEDWTATQNGKPLTFVSRGGNTLVWSSSYTPQGVICSMPTFESFAPDITEEVTTFIFSDGHDEIVAEFLNLNTPLSLRLVSPQDGLLRPGQTAVVAYAPETDRLGEPGLELGRNDGSGINWLRGTTRPRQEGATFTFTVPLSVPPGEAELSLRATAVSGVSRCSSTCIAQTLKHARLTVRIAPFAQP
ncbi:hypothetical protein [Archangium lipolyticum]|uniref:hypothetical protein n=1 Tax=Archangium lipolyticum TaxID=2970465 RepID=UPI00214A6584|nr:hypothetical protein [Archangium lipolyticum]